MTNSTEATMAPGATAPPSGRRAKDANRPDFAKLRRQKKRVKRKLKKAEKREEAQAAAGAPDKAEEAPKRPAKRATGDQPGKAKRRKVETTATPQAEAAIQAPYAFPIDDMDHCETPSVAYAHLSPFLDEVCKALGKTRGELRIYDPYYCEGGVRRRLGALGFPQVYNENEDFYARLESGSVPDFDVLVTNPPYSEEHIGKLLAFAAELPHGRFFALLVPNFAYHKYAEVALFRGATNPFFLCPKRRYEYVTVKGRHQKKSAHKTAPFVSMWYLGVGSDGDGSGEDTRAAALSGLRAKLKRSVAIAVEAFVGAGDITEDGAAAAREVRLSQRVDTLPDDVLDHNDPRAKRLRNAKKRKKHKARRQTE